METLLQDIRYGLRILFKRPGFTLAAVLSLSLAIGANSAIFSIVNAVLLRALPFNEPEQLTKIWDSSPRQTGERNSVSYPNFTDWREQAEAFQDMAAVYPAYLNLVGGTAPERIRVDWVSESYFRVLGIQPVLGRSFLPEEDSTPDSHPVMVVSHNLWQRRFNSDPGLVNSTVRLNDNNYTVVGIMPEGFSGVDGDTEIWLPIMMISAVRAATVLNDRGASWHEVIARLKANVTLRQAQKEIETVTARLEQSYPETNQNKGGVVIPLREEKFGKIQRPLIILLGSVGFVLLIACANVANLLLARAMGRRREIALRMALGADRKRLVRQLLTESLLLGLLGGLLGLLLAYWMLNSLVGLIPVEIPRFVKINIDGTVLGFNVAISILTGLIFGLIPALQASKTNLSGMLKEAGKGSVSGGEARRGALWSFLKSRSRWCC
jgi:putative ABC transport system permease protein